jgi:hypothetical protein
LNAGAHDRLAGGFELDFEPMRSSFGSTGANFGKLTDVLKLMTAFLYQLSSAAFKEIFRDFRQGFCRD